MVRYILEIEETELPLVLNDVYDLEPIGYIFDDSPEIFKYYITIDEVQYIIGQDLIDTYFEEVE